MILVFKFPTADLAADFAYYCETETTRRACVVSVQCATRTDEIDARENADMCDGSEVKS